MCVGYVVRSADGLLLFDTGIGVADAETEAHYRPTRRPLTAALQAVGAHQDEIRWIVNCHLHFDHCGGNPQLSGRPIFTQPAELAAAREAGYTIPELVDLPGARYESVHGKAEILPSVWLMPTPGHTPGHQSLAVRCADGTVVLAGQAHDFASHYTADQLAWRAHGNGDPAPLPAYPGWIDDLQQFDPSRVVFAHDLAVWEPAVAGQ
jgi:glyoxylase-like metal-dependent hydrolase (beta-lactamase superfamily II)